MGAGRANTPAPSKLLVILAFAAVYILWGSSYLAIRYTVETLPPFLMAGTRAFAAGALLFTVVGVSRVRTLTLTHWRAATISGGLLFLGGHGLLFRMERSVDSSAAALMLATIPGWMTIISCFAWHTSLTARSFVGILLGLAGVALLVSAEDHAGRSVLSPLSACVLLASAASWACGSLCCRSATLPKHSGAATAMQLMCGGALAILVGLLAGEGRVLDLANVSQRSILSLLYLIIIGSLLTFSAYAWLLRVAGPAAVGAYAYVSPLIAVLMGWLLGGEAIGFFTIAAAIVIVISVVIIHHDHGRSGR